MKLMNRGLHQTQSVEAGAIEAAVTGEQAIRLAQGMGADQKVRYHSRSGAPSLPIGLPRDSRFESSFDAESTEFQIQPVAGFVGRGRGSKRSGDLRPHHFASNQPALPKRGTNRLGRSWSKGQIGTEYIEQDVAVYGGNHLGLSRPRSSSIISSVERP